MLATPLSDSGLLFPLEPSDDRLLAPGVQDRDLVRLGAEQLRANEPLVELVATSSSSTA